MIKSIARNDEAVRDLLERDLADAATAVGVPLTGAQCHAIAVALLPTARDIVRIKRPIYRPADFIERTDARHRATNARTNEQATQRMQRWTGPELQVALRRDLTVEQAATMLGRSFYAVRAVRKKVAAGDPRLVRLANQPTTFADAS